MIEDVKVIAHYLPGMRSIVIIMIMIIMIMMMMMIYP